MNKEISHQWTSASPHEHVKLSNYPGPYRDANSEAREREPRITVRAEVGTSVRFEFDSRCVSKALTARPTAFSLEEHPRVAPLLLLKASPHEKVGIRCDIVCVWSKRCASARALSIFCDNKQAAPSLR